MKLKDLCERYNVPYDSAHTKLCLSKLSKLCEFTKNGRDYTIIREYTEEEKFALSNAKFSEYITDLLIKQLSLTAKNVYTYIELYENMGMVNSFYKSARANIYSKDEYKAFYEVNKFSYDFSQFDADNGMTEYNIVESNLRKFFFTSNKLLKEIVRNSLNSMQKRRLIYWKPTYRLYKKRQDSPPIQHDCTTEEAGQILDWENEALTIVGYKSKWFGNDEKANNTFHDYVNSKIKENFGYDYYGDAIDFTLAIESIQKEAYKIDCRRLLNQNVQTKLLESKEMDNIIRSLNKQFIQEYIKRG